MKIKPFDWAAFLLLSLVSAAIWFHFSYHKYSLANLSVTRSQALRIARDYLQKEKGVNVQTFRSATVFLVDDESDRYLQKALGFKKELEFLHENEFELFFWLVRFFRENTKEEYRLTISSATGEITAFTHLIEETESRPFIDKETAKMRAAIFLERKFGVHLEDYQSSGEVQRHLDNRTDYAFAWQKKGISLAWDHAAPHPAASGRAELLMGATLSGDEIITFSKNKLDIPDQFNRYLSKLSYAGRNYTLLFRIFNMLLITASIYYVVLRRHHLIMHSTKKFYFLLAVGLFLLNLLNELNDLQIILFQFNTTSSLNSYLWRYSIEILLQTFFITIGFPLTCLAGESLRFEVFREKREGSFLYYLSRGFLNRNVFAKINLGYLVAIIMIGLQSLILEIGHRFWGVWMEHSWKTQFTSSYLPFVSAFVLGAMASLYEETTFRMFAISLGKKFFKNAVIAGAVASIIWGFGHTGYNIYPMWFRGIEVTVMGLFLSRVYLRFGILVVVVAHYAFDVFWTSSGYFLSKANPIYFYPVLFVLLLPFFFGLWGFFLNRTYEEKPLRWQLNKHQLFHLSVLRFFLEKRKQEGRNLPEIKKELLSHGWDIAVVETAFEELEIGPLKYS